MLRNMNFALLHRPHHQPTNRKVRRLPQHRVRKPPLPLGMLALHKRVHARRAQPRRDNLGPLGPHPRRRVVFELERRHGARRERRAPRREEQVRVPADRSGRVHMREPVSHGLGQRPGVVAGAPLWGVRGGRGVVALVAPGPGGGGGWLGRGRAAAHRGAAAVAGGVGGGAMVAAAAAVVVDVDGAVASVPRGAGGGAAAAGPRGLA